MTQQEIESALQNLDRRVKAIEEQLGLSPPIPGKPLQGVDVYRGQGDIDWDQVARAGFHFAIVKATEGVNFIDKKLTRNAKGASRAGLKIGYYHFGRPDTGSDHQSDARAEAADFLEAIAPLPDPDVLRFESGGSAAVWLDLEKAVDNLDEKEGLAWIVEWLRVVEKQWPVGL